MKSNYNDCLSRLLKDEGGYTNDPRDPGGATNFGITIADYRKYINKYGTAEDVKNMTVGDAKRIYKPKYWDVMGCDELTSGVDYTVFDYGVNSGVGRARKVLGKFNTLSGVPLINAINNERLAFLQSLKTWPVFGKGWGPRVERVRKYSTYLESHGPKDNTTAPVASGGLAGLGIAISQYFHQHEAVILIGTAVLAVAIGAAIHLYRNKGN